jgi:hypothetical protein
MAPRLAGEETLYEAKYRRETVRPQPSLHGGVTVRIPKVTMKDLLYDMRALKDLIRGTEFDAEILKFLDGKMEEVQIISFPCATHGYVHIQIVPTDKEPMGCAEDEERKKGGGRSR